MCMSLQPTAELNTSVTAVPWGSQLWLDTERPLVPLPRVIIIIISSRLYAYCQELLRLDVLGCTVYWWRPKGNRGSAWTPGYGPLEFLWLAPWHFLSGSTWNGSAETSACCVEAKRVWGWEASWEPTVNCSTFQYGRKAGYKMQYNCIGQSHTCAFLGYFSSGALL